MALLSQTLMMPVRSTDGESELLDSIKSGGLQKRGESLRANVPSAFIQDEESVPGTELGEQTVRLFALGGGSVTSGVRFVLNFLKRPIAIQTFRVVLRR